MAKKTISRLSVLAVLIVFLAACSKTSEYTNVIPADASVVASINLKSLASKAGLDDKENEAAKQKVLEALKSGMNAATFQQLEKVMKNPGESGIDVESPFYVFSSSSFPYPTVVGKVNNEDNLHASLDVMAKEQICQPISEADGYSFTTMNGGLLAFMAERICRCACFFLLSVPLCLMMMYWWFISPMRCMKSLPSSAQSVSVKLELSSIEGLTSKRRQLFFTFGKSVK